MTTPVGVSGSIEHVGLDAFAESDDSTIRIIDLEAKHESNSYVFNQACMARVDISNFESNALVIADMSIEVRNIVRDMLPRLSIEPTELNNGAATMVTNIGWGDLPEFDLTFVCKDPDFAKFFGATEIVRHFDSLSVADCATVSLVGNADLMIPPDGDYTFYIDSYVQSASEQEIDIECEDVNVTIIDGIVGCAYGEGGGGYDFYGFCIDTDKNSFSQTIRVSEVIEPHSALTMPVCFFMKNSAEFDIRVVCRAKQNGTEAIIDTGWLPMEAQVRSDYGAYSTYDIRQCDIAHIYEEALEGHDIVVSYPVSRLDPDTFKNEFDGNCIDLEASIG